MLKNLFYKSGLDLFLTPTFMLALFIFSKKHNNRCTLACNRSTFHKSARDRKLCPERENLPNTAPTTGGVGTPYVSKFLTEPVALYIR
jgi:hypothetical protein